MKQILSILISLACFACTKPSNTTEGFKADTLVRSEFRTTHKSITEEDRRTKSLTYFVEINKDSSECAFRIDNSMDYGLNMSINYYPRYSKNPKNYEQRLAELQKILPIAEKDFPLDSLQAISMVFASLGDIAIEVTNKFGQNTVNNQHKDYAKVEQLLLESRLRTDLKAIFKPYGIEVEKIWVEKLWPRTKKELIEEQYFNAQDKLPENILDAMVSVQFMRK